MNVWGLILFIGCGASALYCIYKACVDIYPEDQVSYKVPPIHPHPPLECMTVDELLRYCDDLGIKKPKTKKQKEIVEYVKNQL